MSLFRKREAPIAPLSCDEVVARYARILELNPFGNAALPYEPELIKAAIVSKAVELGTPEAERIAREGFVALSTFTGKSRKIDLSTVDEDEMIALIDKECDDLACEFDRRVALKREFLHA